LLDPKEIKDVFVRIKLQISLVCEILFSVLEAVLRSLYEQAFVQDGLCF